MQMVKKQRHGQKIRAAAGREIARDKLPVQRGDLRKLRHAAFPDQRGSRLPCPHSAVRAAPVEQIGVFNRGNQVQKRHRRGVVAVIALCKKCP